MRTIDISEEPGGTQTDSRRVRTSPEMETERSPLMIATTIPLRGAKGRAPTTDEVAMAGPEHGSQARVVATIRDGRALRMIQVDLRTRNEEIGPPEGTGLTNIRLTPPKLEFRRGRGTRDTVVDGWEAEEVAATTLRMLDELETPRTTRLALVEPGLEESSRSQMLPPAR